LLLYASSPATWAIWGSLIYRRTNKCLTKTSGSPPNNPTTMVSHIDYLEEIQCVQRVRNPKDRRYFVLKVTKQAKEKLRLVERYLETIELDVLSGISVKEQKELKSILLRVWTTISKKGK